ncbi:hypothetical protein L596_006018 [Steinernema carpocapsae]|uniref:Uncharacterized protein n=1 Tax=Steinernema carpocapsae TaxID=34508 RepID=A0A4U8V7M8_STECR|nr:hypothetical protein L596_006018 [Steinernema carpocapsae]
MHLGLALSTDRKPGTSRLATPIEVQPWKPKAEAIVNLKVCRTCIYAYSEKLDKQKNSFPFDILAEHKGKDTVLTSLYIEGCPKEDDPAPLPEKVVDCTLNMYPTRFDPHQGTQLTIRNLNQQNTYVNLFTLANIGAYEEVIFDDIDPSCFHYVEHVLERLHNHESVTRLDVMNTVLTDRSVELIQKIFSQNQCCSLIFDTSMTITHIPSSDFLETLIGNWIAESWTKTGKTAAIMPMIPTESMQRLVKTWRVTVVNVAPARFLVWHDMCHGVVSVEQDEQNNSTKVNFRKSIPTCDQQAVIRELLSKK